MAASSFYVRRKICAVSQGKHKHYPAFGTEYEPRMFAELPEFAVCCSGVYPPDTVEFLGVFGVFVCVLLGVY